MTSFAACLVLSCIITRTTAVPSKDIVGHNTEIQNLTTTSEVQNLTTTSEIQNVTTTYGIPNLTTTSEMQNTTTTSKHIRNVPTTPRVLNMTALSNSTAMRFDAEPGKVIAGVTEFLTMHCSHNLADFFGHAIGDLDRVVYIIITKATAEGSQEIASMSSFDPPVLKTKEERLTVKGQITPCNNSLPHGEAFLELTWAYPMRKEAGSYVCEMSTLSQSKHQSTHYSSLEVKVSTPTVEELTQELIKVKMESGRPKTELADRMSRFERSQSQRLEASRRRILSGMVTLDTDGSAYYNEYVTSKNVTYAMPFRNPPETVLSITAIELPDQGNHIVLSVLNETEAGFTIKAVIDTKAGMKKGINVSWLSFGG